jgi:hypothetical protein
MVDNERMHCDICGKVFDSQKVLAKHKDYDHDHHHDDMHKLESTEPRESRSWNVSKKLITLTSIGILLIALGAGVGVYDTMGLNLPPQPGLTINGIQCNTTEHLQFHVHAHLDIFVNGHLVSIPAHIGIVDNKCIYWLHTHDSTGVIHIESPVKRDFTLGQFFEVWKSQLNSPKAFDAILAGKLVPTVYVNGNKVPSSVSYKDVKLNPHDEIAVVYGAQPKSIPSKYSFAQGL